MWKYFCKCQNKVIKKYYPSHGCHCWIVDGITPNEIAPIHEHDDTDVCDLEIAEESIRKIRAIEFGREKLTNLQKKAGYFICHKNKKLLNAYFESSETCGCYQKIKKEFLRERPYIGSIRALLEKLDNGCIK